MTRYYELDGRGRGKAHQRPDTLNSAHVFILGFGVLSLVIAVVMIALRTMGASDGTDPDVDELLLWWPIASVIGAIAGLVAGMLVKRRTNWRLCMACMVVATVSTILYCIPALPLVIMSLMMVAVGAVMTIRVNANRDAFTSREGAICIPGCGRPVPIVQWSRASRWP